MELLDALRIILGASLAFLVLLGATFLVDTLS